MNSKRISVTLFCLGSILGAPQTEAQVAIRNDGVEFPDTSVQTTAAPGPYVVGGTGPAGGFVFYVTSDGQHGLEAAPEDLPNAIWGCSGTTLAGAGGTAIGTGTRNTDDITPYGCPTAGIAAAAAADYVSPSNYFDWYLPSQDELVLMHATIGQGNTNTGNFADGGYWTSTESSASLAIAVDFNSGSAFLSAKSGSGRVRPIRTF